ncbi:T9SS type A sorting domain-containing protein [Formosa sediminum]|uniref:T9SS type A sorting domain-containing protein n=1 Tax=Formosa sediminum TaxID=2594004 RepID=A0A516GR74_9FLAO|nr:choice-of-anchor I family protein [Formosa sediminum]QDO94024.1 T9SS type A sorting domain-containing protein [Formosa sediminum]
MKKRLLLLTLFIGGYLNAQINPGDMAFIGMNADGDDDFALVTFVDIPANTTIHFADKEWTGTAFNSGEAAYSWLTGDEKIIAGSVISFNTISEIPSVNYGTINGEPGGLSSSSEAIFAYLGTDVNTPTTFIAAVANATGAFGDLSNTGLTEGLTAITYSPDGVDIAVYNGMRTGLDQNGYLLALNDMSNYDIQDTDEDDHNDGIAPESTFSTTPFTISSEDLTAPSVVSIKTTTNTTTEVVFSENITQVSAETISNYSFTPALTISNISYNATSHTATLTHDGFIEGTGYMLTVTNIKDLAENMQPSSFTSDYLFYNTITSGLIITEIMYNAPSDNSDALEFLEIYNTTTETISLGGLQVKDESNFVFIFPEMNLEANAMVLLATDKTTADAFYGVNFLDMPQGISNALGNGGEVLQILNTQDETIFAMEYSDDEPWPTAADGDGPSLELINPEINFNEGTNWAASTNLIGESLGEKVYASPGTFNTVSEVVPQLTFTKSIYNISEDAAEVNIQLDLSAASNSEITADINLVSELITATPGTDFTFSTQTITIPANTTVYTLNIPLTDDSQIETDELFILQLSNINNATLGNFGTAGIYIIDNDQDVISATDPLNINFKTSYTVDTAGSAEISAYDATTQRLFVLNSVGKTIEILNFSNPENLSTIKTIDLSTYGTEGPTSVAVYNGLVAASVSNGPEANGVVLLMDTNGENITQVTVGNLPDNVSFSPDGTKLLTANEGQPNSDYSIDPEGSISIITATAGLGNITQNDVQTINFNAFDAQLSELQANGVRITGPGATVSQDLEPEYITFSDNSKKAWVSLQENNALAIIDLDTNTITDILPLGLKDFSITENTFDASDDTDFIFMANWPVKGMYMPDAISYFELNGIGYVVTANEGDAREYDAFEEEVKVGDNDYILDPIAFPNAGLLKLDENIGRLAVTNASGDTDNDGDFDEIHMFGSRSFSIRNATTGALVYDSADDFERITASDPTYAELFNTSNSNNNFKNRSDNKGPEPEGITVANIAGKFYAFITLERVGGFMTYDITDPTNPTFIKYINNRTLGDNEGGDLGPEGIIYIAPEDNTLNTGLIVLSNEVSSTISVYSLENITTLGVNEATEESHTFKVYPNPVQSNNIIYFNTQVNVSLYDLQGRLVISKENVNTLNIPAVTSGTYILKTDKGSVKKIIIK